MLLHADADSGALKISIASPFPLGSAGLGAM